MSTVPPTESPPENAATPVSGKPALEAIAYQKKSRLFLGLTSIFEQFMALPVQRQTREELIKLGFESLVLKETGMNFKIHVTVDEVNAYIYPKILNKANPITAARAHIGTVDYVFTDMIRYIGTIIKTREDLTAMIDLEKGRVSGLFSKIPLAMIMGTGLWTVAKMTPSEVAAIAIHELGHGFTYYEAAIWGVCANLTMTSAKQALAKETDPQIRLRIVADSTRALNINNPDLDVLMQAADSDMEKFETLALSLSVREVLYATKTRSYNRRIHEIAADQFATRHGAAAALTTGMARAVSFGYSSGLAGGLAHWMFQTLQVTLGTVASILPNVALFYIGELTRMDEDSLNYDTPVKRIRRMEMDLIQILKDRTLSSDEQREIQSSIATLRQVTLKYADRRKLFDMIGMTLTKYRRGQVSAKKFEEELEQLVNSNLFVHASTLKTLS